MPWILSPVYLFYKIQISITCALFGKKVGVDQYKNKYFILRKKNAFGKNKRICIYYNLPEATKIPAIWADWMHYRTNSVPSSSYKPKYSWILPHLPNITLSKYKYRHLTSAKYNAENDLIPRLNLKNQIGVRKYQAWSPTN